MSAFDNSSTPDNAIEAIPTVLVVDDDEALRLLVCTALEQRNFNIIEAADGETAISLFHKYRPDIVLLDVMMPGEDGLSVCRRLRATSELPVIMLTAMGEDTDRIIGLEIGADDYLPKPFNPRELLARIRAILRRSEPTRDEPVTDNQFHFEGWTLDPRSRALTSPTGADVELTSGEFDLLIAFVERPKDRKSTRLNSSHDQISYAVFCLKNNNSYSLISLTITFL